MAFEGIQQNIPGLKAGADYSAASNQYKFVKLNAARQVILCAAVTDRPIGVLQNTPKSGEEAEVCGFGVTKIVGAAATAAGSQLGTDGSGLAAIYVPGTDTTKYIVGIALDATAAASGLVSAFINCASAARGA